MCVKILCYNKFSDNYKRCVLSPLLISTPVNSSSLYAIDAVEPPSAVRVLALLTGRVFITVEPLVASERRVFGAEFAFNKTKFNNSVKRCVCDDV